MQHDYTRSLKSQSYKQNAKLVQKGECWTWNQRLIRGLGSILTGGHILLLEFWNSDANIGIIANFWEFRKTSIDYVLLNKHRRS